MFDLPTILKPNATELERALERAIRKVKPDLTPIAKLMNPETCPAHLLGWLAWAFSVDVWAPSWSEATKREVIKRSIEIHRIKGTAGAVRRALGTIGFRTDLSEWFEHGGDPHTFRIDAFGDDVFAAGFQVSPELVDMVTRLIDNVKPVRSHFSLRVGESFNVTTTAKAGLRQSRRQNGDLSPRPRGHEIESNLGLAFGMRSRARHVQALAPRPRSHKLGAHLTIKAGLRLHQKHREGRDHPCCNGRWPWSSLQSGLWSDPVEARKSPCAHRTPSHCW